MVSSTTHSANSAPSADKAHERFSAMLHMQSTVTDEGEEGEELVLEKVVEDSGGEDEKDNGKGDGDGGETLPAVGNCRPEKIEEEGDCIVGQMRGQHDVRRQMKRKAVLDQWAPQTEEPKFPLQEIPAVLLDEKFLEAQEPVVRRALRFVELKSKATQQ